MDISNISFCAFRIALQAIRCEPTTQRNAGPNSAHHLGRKTFINDPMHALLEVLVNGKQYAHSNAFVFMKCIFSVPQRYKKLIYKYIYNVHIKIDVVN